MQKLTPLKHGLYYHIYNRGIDSCNLFAQPENYEYFLGLYDKYISRIADTYAWVLMPNHFHFLVRIKKKEEILNQSGFSNQSGLKPPHQYFSNLFNAYSKAVNKRYFRHGALFERPFRRKHIDNIPYLKNAIVYIHKNPVHHKFCDDPKDYPWSSYQTCISVKPTKLMRDKVIGWFDDKANFITRHHQNDDFRHIEDWLEL
jgi:putative transposase